MNHAREALLSFWRVGRQSAAHAAAQVCRCVIPPRMTVTPCVQGCAHLARVLHLLSAPCPAVASAPCPSIAPSSSSGHVAAAAGAPSPSCSHRKPLFSSQADSCPSPAGPAGPAPAVPRLFSSPSPSPASGVCPANDVVFTRVAS